MNTNKNTNKHRRVKYYHVFTRMRYLRDKIAKFQNNTVSEEKYEYYNRLVQYLIYIHA